MIEVGVPFENPVAYVPISEETEKPKKPTIGNGNMKLDCSKIGKSAIDYLVRTLKKYLKVYLIGGNVIYTEGSISGKHYAEVWKTLDCFDVRLMD